MGLNLSEPRTLARFLRDVADVLERLVEEGVSAPRAEDGNGADVALPPALADAKNLGWRQRQILGLPELGSDAGARTSEIAKRLTYDQPNVWSTLQRLVAMGFVELIPESQPQRWRLAPAYR